MVTNQHTISSAPPEQPGLNVLTLKQQALKTIQQLAGETWTDHNIHDPGITILEILCYVITDLSYRLSFPITDLLQPQSTSESIHHYWLSHEILPSPPVTITDFRRLIVDTPGVKNAWLEANQQQQTASLWNVVVLAEPWVSEHEQLALAHKIRTRFSELRNVGEDIQQINFLPTVSIHLTMNMVLAHGSDIEQVMISILQCLTNYLSPTIPRKFVNELIKKDISYDEVYDGPLLENGFISQETINSIGLRKTVFTSDLISEVLQHSSVELLSTLVVEVPSATAPINTMDSDNWVVELNQHSNLQLDIERTLQQLSLKVGSHQVFLDESAKQRIIDSFNEADSTDQQIPNHSNKKPDILLIEGRYRQLKKYKTLQAEFPMIYSLGRQGLAEQAPPEKKAQIKQLQGFLLLFDQVLANQFSQLEQVRTLLSLPDMSQFSDIKLLFDKMLASQSLSEQDIHLFWLAIKQLPVTHASQPIDGINNISALLEDYLDTYQSPQFSELTELHFSQTKLDRIKRSFQHLLARFHEQMSDPSVMQYSAVIGNYLSKLSSHPKALSTASISELSSKLVQLKHITDMALMLSEYPVISQRRCGGYDYLNNTPFNDNNIAGLLRRISRLMGIHDIGHRPLALYNKEGFHLIEGILLRHRETPIDPSDSDQLVSLNQLYFILPSWPTRFANSHFREVLAETINTESPMHLSPVIIYLDREVMSIFDRTYNAWLNAMTQLPCDTNAPESLYSFDQNNSIPVANQTPDQISTDLIKILSNLLYEFCHAPDDICKTCLMGTSVEDIQPIVERWLSDTDFSNIFDSGKNHQSIVTTLLEKLPAEKIIALCQTTLDEIIKPYTIGEDESEIGVTYRVGYPPIEVLKPIYPLNQTIINPDSPTEHQAFSVAIAEPHTI